MKRKVIQLAGSTLVVSLPSSWAKKNNVKKGEEVDVDEKGSELCISTQNAMIEDSTSVSIVGIDPMVKRALGALYKAGYDEVEVEFAPEELRTAQEVIREEFVGFEVVYKGKNTLTVKKISSIDPEHFDTMLRRMFLLLLQMAEESLEAVLEKDKEWLKAIAFMDKDMNKYADFCRRVLNKYGYKKYRVTSPVYFVVEQMEKIGDCYRDICVFAAENNPEIDPDLFSEVNSFVEMFYKLFYSFDLKELAKFGKKRYELRDQFMQLLSEGDSRMNMCLYNIVDNTFDMNGALMAVNL